MGKADRTEYGKNTTRGRTNQISELSVRAPYFVWSYNNKIDFILYPNIAANI